MATIKRHLLCYCSKGGDDKVMTPEELAPLKRGEKRLMRPCKNCGKPMEPGPWVVLNYKGGKRAEKSFAKKEHAEDYKRELENGKKADAPKLKEVPITWGMARQIFTEYLSARVALLPPSLRPVERRGKKPDIGQSPCPPLVEAPPPGLLQDAAKNRKPLSLKSKIQYLSDLNTMERLLLSGVPSMQDLTISMVQDYMDELLEDDYGPSTVNSHVMTLQYIYKIVALRLDVNLYFRLHAVKDRIRSVNKLELNPVHNIFLEIDECKMLLAECKDYSLDLYHFVFGILNTGLRRSDMLKLRRAEVNFATGVITTTVKGRKVVHIPLSLAYRTFLLEEWFPSRKVESINGYLFPSHTYPSQSYGSTRNLGLRTVVKRLSKKAAAMGNYQLAEKWLLITPHKLRHTFATHWIYNNIQEKGVDGVVRMLSNILGHTSKGITDRYIHILQSYQHDAMANYTDKMFPRGIAETDT